MRRIFRKDLIGIRDAANAFLIVFLWERSSGGEVNENAAIKTIELMQNEINKFHVTR